METLMKRIFYSLLVALLVSAKSYATQAADYFARFKYNVADAISLLKKADGQPLSSNIEAKNLLDDMGYWKVVRSSGVFHFTPDLEKNIKAQYQYLQKAFSYEAGDLVWMQAENQTERPYGIAGVNHRAVIVDKANHNGTDYYVVEMLVDGPSKMAHTTGTFYDGKQGQVMYYGPNYSLEKLTKIVTKAEIDALNSPASSLPVDNVGEKLDWANDTVWQDKLEAFKSKMASQNFEINWTASSDEIYSKQQELMLQIFRHFKMNRNAPSNSGRGIGLRSCGGGVCFDQALVLTYAIQAVGQTSGIKAFNLNGTTVNPMGGHGFVRYDLKTKTQEITFDRAFSLDYWQQEKKKVNYTNAQGGVPQLDIHLDPTKATYPGVTIKTSTFSGISDPGWADYGVTPDFFARIPVTSALNPIPIDSNRAVNGLSSQRSLVEVAEKVQAKGPLAVNTAQATKTIDQSQRVKLVEEFKKSSKTNNALSIALANVMGSKGMSCNAALSVGGI